MVRPLRVSIENGWYHITARGNERQAIFRDDQDRKRFLAWLEESVDIYHWQVHAYVLMPNHYHLLVQTPRANLSLAMQWLHTAYSVWFNRRHHRVGHLFQGRFTSILVEPESWALPLSSYLHLNPVRTRALGLDKNARARQRHGLDGPPRSQAVNERVQRLREYRWSSYRAYIGLDAPPPWLHMNPVLERIGHGSSNQRHEKYRSYVEQQIREGLPASPWEQLVERTVLGAERFVRKVRQRLPSRARDVTGLKALRHRGTWAEVVAAVETTLQQPWKQFRDLYGNPGRDMAFYLGRKVAGLKLSELGRAAGDLDFRSVGAAIVRFERRLERDKHLCKLLENAKIQMQNAEL
jgi:REP element-mobilizing transposase RayT